MFFASPYDDQDFFAASEQQNCLEEARIVAISDRGPIPHHGHGPFTVTVSSPIYCRSTDAFAGYMVREIRHFPSREAATAWACELDEDLDFRIAPAPVYVHDEVIVGAADEIPF